MCPSSLRNGHKWGQLASGRAGVSIQKQWIWCVFKCTYTHTCTHAYTHTQLKEKGISEQSSPQERSGRNNSLPEVSVLFTVFKERVSTEHLPPSTACLWSQSNPAMTPQVWGSKCIDCWNNCVYALVTDIAKTLPASVLTDTFKGIHQT